MSLAHDWPVPIGFGIVALVLGGMALLALYWSNALKFWKAIVVGCATLTPPAIIVFGVVFSWQPGQPHAEKVGVTRPVLLLASLGLAASLWSAALCLAADKRISVGVSGMLACLLLLSLTFIALLAAGQGIAGASL